MVIRDIQLLLLTPFAFASYLLFAADLILPVLNN